MVENDTGLPLVAGASSFYVLQIKITMIMHELNYARKIVRKIYTAIVVSKKSLNNYIPLTFMVPSNHISPTTKGSSKLLVTGSTILISISKY